jgi:pimeloyl-ACP methyl ester carboxylesterase
MLAIAQPTPLEPCWVKGVARQLQCGRVRVAENPDRPDGRRLEVRFAVMPAAAKNRAPDPLFVFAGGPGQAATQAAGHLQPILQRINARRDIVFVDQRGTGDSNPLVCARPQAATSLSEAVNAQIIAGTLARCVERLMPSADPAQYATWIAVRDIDTVRRQLGAEQINLWGASYGTRAALEYLRQYPQRVRSAILDGVAPAGMALPASAAVDADNALQRMLDACLEDAHCRQLDPAPQAALYSLAALAAQRAQVRVPHPLTGATETIALDSIALAGVLRAALYTPQQSSMLPYALAQAGGGDFTALFALQGKLLGRLEQGFGELMHFAVICAEDMPLVDGLAVNAARATRFGTGLIDLYREACRHIPTRSVPPEFYAMKPVDVPVLILSGGLDPVTGPRWGDWVAKRLPRSLHLGHGISGQGCVPDLLHRFVRQAGTGNLDDGCLKRIPAARPYRPVGTEAAG